MIQCRGGTGFPLEPFQRRMIFGVIVRQKLESNRSAEAGVLGFVHDTHTTTPDLFKDAVMGNGLAGHRRHTAALTFLLPRASSGKCSLAGTRLSPTRG